jgi:hypothetical protein
VIVDALEIMGIDLPTHLVRSPAQGLQDLQR